MTEIELQRLIVGKDGLAATSAGITSTSGRR
jgi:hypothetical protein